MHHARLLGAAKEQEGLPCSQLRERTARQRGVEQLGAPRRGPRHVASRGKGNAQPARIPDRHGGHLFDLGERAHHRRGAERLQAHRGHHRPHRRVGGYHRRHEAYLQLQSVVREGDGAAFRPMQPMQNRRKIFRRFYVGCVRKKQRGGPVRDGVRQGSGDLRRVGRERQGFWVQTRPPSIRGMKTNGLGI